MVVFFKFHIHSRALCVEKIIAKSFEVFWVAYILRWVQRASRFPHKSKQRRFGSKALRRPDVDPRRYFDPTADDKRSLRCRRKLSEIYQLCTKYYCKLCCLSFGEGGSKIVSDLNFVDCALLRCFTKTRNFLQNSIHRVYSFSKGQIRSFQKFHTFNVFVFPNLLWVLKNVPFKRLHTEHWTYSEEKDQIIEHNFLFLSCSVLSLVYFIRFPN